jgi:hypothetical protein
MSEETNWCPAAKAKRYGSFTAAMKAMNGYKALDGEPRVIEKCGRCQMWHVVFRVKPTATTDGPVLSTRSAGAFVGTKIL